MLESQIGGGQSARDSALPSFPELARCLAVTKFADNNGVEHLYMAIKPGIDGRKRSRKTRVRRSNAPFSRRSRGGARFR